MILTRFNTNSMYGTQRVLFLTDILNKKYFWMQDGDGTIYLLPEVDGEPSFS